MPLLFGAWRLFFCALGAGGDPDAARPGAGGAARRPRRRGARAASARSADRAARRTGWRCGSGRGWRRACARRRRSALERKLDYAGRPGGMTVQRFIGLKARARAAARPRPRRPAAAARRDADLHRRCSASAGWFGPGRLALAGRAAAPGGDRAHAAGLPGHPRRQRARRPRLPLRAAPGLGVARRARCRRRC